MCTDINLSTVNANHPHVTVRNTRSEDIEPIVAMSRLVYGQKRKQRWLPEELLSHLRVFPQGQLVAVDRDSGAVVGMAASLILLWDDYETSDTWMDFTGGGTFDTHDPEGRTLYGAEVMVHPDHQGKGIGKALYAARRELCRVLGLRRIRAGARLRGYHGHADELTPRHYVAKVMSGELGDPTLSFQLKQGFKVLAVVSDYLDDDEDSLGYAALIEWINPEVARPEDIAGQGKKFERQLQDDTAGSDI
ncbi:GNAT family N-acetyltransferase [Phycisphaerales bacterium AB-hyl4]|uniref:GNAT family N-acetyltransferase n=1 Tax=Natronomicrosphaera hydrolytica TaxID=3242702 RepID=A0ABV4U8G9_9BACT